MASSSIGIQELDYSQIPFDLFNPSIVLKKIAWRGKNIYLISGIKKDDDIIRGEKHKLLELLKEFIVKKSVNYYSRYTFKTHLLQ